MASITFRFSLALCFTLFLLFLFAHKSNGCIYFFFFFLLLFAFISTLAPQHRSSDQLCFICLTNKKNIDHIMQLYSNGRLSVTCRHKQIYIASLIKMNLEKVMNKQTKKNRHSMASINNVSAVFREHRLTYWAPIFSRIKLQSICKRNKYAKRLLRLSNKYFYFE